MIRASFKQSEKVWNYLSVNLPEPTGSLCRAPIESVEVNWQLKEAIELLKEETIKIICWQAKLSASLAPGKKIGFNEFLI